MGYFVREHIFIGFGPAFTYDVPVFWTDDLTEEEARTLAASVQNALHKLNDNHGGGPWYFELAPSPQEDAVAFVNWKDEWRDVKRFLENPESITPDSWEAEFAWLNKIAQDHATIIREMRTGQTPTIFLQCDSGHGYETFDCVDSLTWDEIETLEKVAESELNEMGTVLRIIDDWHAEREPDVYVQAKLSWKWFEVRLETDEDDDDLRMLARRVVQHCIEEILALRNKPVVYGREDDEDEVDDDNGDEVDDDAITAVDIRDDPLPFLDPEWDDDVAENEEPPPKEPSDELRSKYHDPENYWRNVWLYEQRKAGKTNKEILEALNERSTEYAPLNTDNALRRAINSIGQFHQWPELKGKTGRPKGSDSTG